MDKVMQPIRRNLDFQLPAARINDWNAAGVHASTFYNTMSLFFPVGERFFIRSVRNYRDRIDDPRLQEAVTGFIGQEAMHGREHEEYNEHAHAAGLPVKAQERRVARLLQWVERRRTPAEQLAATCALEHLTAILADILLREPRLLEGAEPRYRDLWEWHALEETEHKAVAYDVYRAVVGTGLKAYLLRCSIMLSSSLRFLAQSIYTHYRLLKHDGLHRDWKGWRRYLHFVFVRPGFLRRIALPWLAYFRPGFHPWQTDNRHHVERWKMQYALPDPARTAA
jgi:uncharacterized protein